MSRERPELQEQAGPPYDAKAVANFFLRKDMRITQMKLHKLLYYAHGWHLAICDELLLGEMVEAWEHGPVVPSIYHEFKDVGTVAINRMATHYNLETDEFDIVPQVHPKDKPTLALLDRVWEVYKNFNAIQLSRMTHAAGSPWSRTKEANPGIKGVDIPNEMIRIYFNDTLRKTGSDK